MSWFFDFGNWWGGGEEEVENQLLSHNFTPNKRLNEVKRGRRGEEAVETRIMPLSVEER